VANVSYRYQLLLIPTFLLAAISGQEVRSADPRSTSLLPDVWSEYRSISRTPVSFGGRESELLNEYGLGATEGAMYRSAAGRRMGAEAFRFVESEGGHAAYLFLRPTGAVNSPVGEYADAQGTSGETHAVVGSGVTVVGRNNYVFRFKGSAPTNREMEVLLERAPAFDRREPGKGECCRYFVEASERIVLGPVSLVRFAPRIPPSVAAFGPGVQGRVARFETPAGAMSKIVFEYPAPGIAAERVKAFRTLPGARVHLVERKIGIIFDAASVEEADTLLKDIAPGTDELPPATFDLRNMADVEITLEDAMSSTFFASCLGCLIAILRAFAQRRDGIPDRTIALHITRD